MVGAGPADPVFTESKDPRGRAPPRSDIDVFMRDEGIMTEHPRIGIRPTIDGRRKGVRESLEEQTL